MSLSMSLSANKQGKEELQFIPYIVKEKNSHGLDVEIKLMIQKEVIKSSQEEIRYQNNENVRIIKYAPNTPKHIFNIVKKSLISDSDATSKPFTNPSELSNKINSSIKVNFGVNLTQEKASELFLSQSYESFNNIANPVIKKNPPEDLTSKILNFLKEDNKEKLIEITCHCKQAKFFIRKQEERQTSSFYCDEDCYRICELNKILFNNKV